MSQGDMDKLEGDALRAQALVRQGSLDEAERILVSIPNSPEPTGYLHEKVTALVRLGAGAMKVHDRDRAIRVLESLESAMPGLHEGMWMEAEARAQAALLWKRLGFSERALRSWELGIQAVTQTGAEHDADNMKVLAGIARDLAASGFKARAEEVESLVPAEWRQRGREWPI